MACRGKVVDVSRSEVPQPWAKRMIERGYTRRDGGPNISALARSMEVSVETARRAVKGMGTPEPETVAALADKLGSDVQDWIGQTVASGPYQPPSESALLTDQQRQALTDLIRAITAEQRQKVGGEHVRSAPNIQAGESPASGDFVTEEDSPALSREEVASPERARVRGRRGRDG